MGILSREKIKKIVFDVIRSILQRKDLAISEEDSINFQTIMYGDDFGSLFVMEVEEILGIRTPTRDWSTVYSVGDAIDLLVRAMEDN